MESSEEDTDWEQIQHPPQGAPFEYELVIRDNFFDDNSSLFPRSEHEDLPLEGQNCHSLSCTISTPRSPLSSKCSDVSTPKEKTKKGFDSRFSVMINEIGIRIYTLGRRVFQGIPSGYSRRCSVVPASALAVVALFACVKILQWRNLVREKDQRISQLMHQIAHMNEILSARRKVPVLRI